MDTATYIAMKLGQLALGNKMYAKCLGISRRWEYVDKKLSNFYDNLKNDNWGWSRILFVCLLGLIYGPKDGGIVFLRNVDEHLPEYVTLLLRNSN
jgi:hypothetical protein